MDACQAPLKISACFASVCDFMWTKHGLFSIKMHEAVVGSWPPRVLNIVTGLTGLGGF